MKKTQWHSSSTGTKAQNTLRESLDSLGYRYTQEEIAISTRTAKRSKGKYDFVVHLSNHDHMIECKSTSGKITIPTITNCNPNIKTHQLKALREAKADDNKAGLILNFRSHNLWVYMSIEQFDKMIYEQQYPLHAITSSLAKTYGTWVKIAESGKLRLRSILEG